MDTLTTNEALVAGGLLGGLLASIGIFALIFYVLMVVAEWKIFAKAGEPGWKSLIPIYNMYVLYKISGIKNWFWYSIIVMFVCNIIASMSGGVEINDAGEIISDPSALAMLAYVVGAVFALFINIYSSYKLAKAFKKGVGFTVGLILLPSIFTLILGFGSAKYDKKVLK